MDRAEEVGILKRERRNLVGNESKLSFDILVRDKGHQEAGVNISAPEVDGERPRRLKRDLHDLRWSGPMP